MGMNWTTEQQKVIDLRDRNILVSAAAGSGKTAVLVERIIQMLTDVKHPMDVDSLLIVTFTEAAAAEMKERIRNAIEKQLMANPEDVHLQRQATLIHSAQIMTIHSFCLSVIREHFHVINIDPGFRIAEEGELHLLKQDVLAEVLEQFYDDGDSHFYQMAERIGGTKSDKKLEERILKVYEYSQSYPQPELWLNQCLAFYKDQNEAKRNLEKKTIEMTERYLKDAEHLLKVLIRICEEADGPYMYADALESDLKLVEGLLACRKYGEISSMLSDIKWKRLSTKKDETVSEDKKEVVKKQRDVIKGIVKDIHDTFFFEPEEIIWKDMKNAAETIESFICVVKAFGVLFEEKKRENNIIDFNDMEHYALRILTREENGKLIPSMVAAEYQEQFQEVMIDEYQDSNLIQETILGSVSRESQGKYNTFMVGDVKQSIYRFRLSRPELFMEKYDTYSIEDSCKQRIDLHKNFRSRKEVLDSVNFVFHQIMKKELGGITYDDKVALNLGADYIDDGTEPSYFQTELLICDPEIMGNEEEGNKKISIDYDNRELEAKMVSKKIKDLIRNGKVTDKDNNMLRNVKYSDIVILTRSMKGWADTFVSILGEEGIPAYSASKEGYFETYEVSVLLDYLKILDNQKQDLPLTAILTSPFAGLCPDEMTRIRNRFPEMHFYEAVENYTYNIEETDVLQQKLQIFYRQIEQFRKQLPYTALHEMLWDILEKTDFGNAISAMPGGEQRRANLDMLIEKAIAFEGTSYKGLFNFIRYIEQLKKYNIDYGEANIADEMADTVRIMSIHKSKGLEFPIVFIVGMGKNFNTTDLKTNIIIHPEMGIGVDCIDLEKRTKATTLLKNLIQKEVGMENVGEELRVLYVAMTRAKEKLIMTGQLKNAEETLCKKKELFRNSIQDEIPYYLLAGAKSYLDWMWPAVLGKQSGINLVVWNYMDAAMEDVVEIQTEELTRDVLEHWNSEITYDKQLKNILQEQLRFQYPYQDYQKYKLKFTVSELKKRIYLEDDGEKLIPESVEPIYPEFVKTTEKLTGASRGTAFHKLMEIIDFSQEYDSESLGMVINQFVSDNRMSKEMADCIEKDSVLKFLTSSVGKRMREACRMNKLKREQPFVFGIDIKTIYPEADSKEIVLVQGIIDVYFEESDEIVLLDYKTDRVQNSSQLIKKYSAQLEYYAKAIENLLQKRVKEKIIYSFCLDEEIML